MYRRRQALTAARGVAVAGAFAASLTALPAAGDAQGNVSQGSVTQGSETQGLAERFAATLSAHDLAAFGALFDEGYVNHQTSAAAPSPPAGKTAREATIGFFGARLAGIPDLVVTIEALVADQRRFAASFVYSGTHGGTYFGVAPTGRPLRFTSCDIFEVRNGRLVEHWGMGDQAGVLAQLKS